ncbi:hypothetical protein L218DRAFT_1072043 [Marasmius fiardii PR-910]|nr:hypothetical protein L218DRAFT_1072043 [Marasmius fiardii PR-910]
MDPSSSTSTLLPQRRVLPSRSRRGGPGVGNCEADQMILDVNRRKPENEPLIPENTRFFLTTNAALAPPELDTIPQLFNSRANERYFDRPELLKACRQQQEIEVPEYENVTEKDTVGGRFRPRGSEDGIVDTSDAAYERRHKKYETFEKRVRLREKEKLRHEQYKLHERIEQLRAMEYSAFLSLPASAFSPAPGRIEGDDIEGPGISGLPGAHINGAAAMNEAERRRQEMLDAAQVIESRYKMLLPPDRVRKVNGSTSSTPILPASSPPPELSDIPIPTRAYAAKAYRREPTDEGESEIDEKDEVLESSPPPPEKPKQPRLLIKINRSAINTPTPPVSTTVSANTKVAKQHTKRVPKPQPQPELNGVFSADTPMSSPDIAVLETSAPSPPAKKRGKKRPRPDDAEDAPEPTSAPPVHRKKSKSQPVLDKEGTSFVPAHRALSQSKTIPQQNEFVAPPTPHSESGPSFNKETSVPPIAFLDESASAPVPRRRGTSSHPARIRSTSAAPRARPLPPPKTCILVVTAERHSIQRVSRKGRNTNAFGCKVPAEIDMELDYELPLWILQDDEFQKRYSKYPDAKDMFNPEMVLNPKFNHKRVFEEQLVDALNSEREREATEASMSDKDDTEEGDAEEEEEVEEEVGGEEEAKEKEEERGEEEGEEEGKEEGGEQEIKIEGEQAKEELEEGDEAIQEETTVRASERAPKRTADEDELMIDVEG